ncbi:hypothetical protein BH23BAC1_BH23BAC1_31000 [soil metagenome]
MKILCYLLIIILFFSACNSKEKIDSLSEIEKWKLGWRMVGSNWDGNYSFGEMQFDSLLTGSENNIDSRFIITGLEILEKLDKKEKLIQILERQDPEIQQDLCNRDLFTQKLKSVNVCKSVKREEVRNPELQLNIIKMYVDDQAARGNLMEEIITKYDLNKDEVTEEGMGIVDGINRQKLKEIINEFGFPTKDMVGKDAMHGIFFNYPAF